MRIRNLQSLLVCSIILWKKKKKLHPTRSDEFLTDGPHCRLWSWTGVCLSLIKCGDVCSDSSEIQGLNPCGQGDEEDVVGFTNTFPDKPCVMSGGSPLRQDLEMVRSIAGWEVTWDCHCVLIQHLQNLSNHSYTSVVPDSWLWVQGWCCDLRTIFLEIPSNVDPWHRFNSSISLRLFIWTSRRSRFCSDNWSWSSWSRRSCSSPARAWSISLRWDSIFPFNFWIFLLSQSTWLLFLNLCSTIGENRLLSFKENPDLLILWVATRFFSAAWT